MIVPDIRPCGDACVLVLFEQTIDPAVNAHVLALAETIRAAGLAGVRDVVPGYASVAVHLDPAAGNAGTLAGSLRALATTSPPPRGPADVVDVPVVYGGAEGPDLADVAAFARARPEDVVERHAARLYRVFMLGFLPGFAYLGSVDRTIAMPRLESPRARVPAGSIGIAGEQTGIYGIDSPGGWRIIGRTPVQTFVADRQPVCLLAPGQLVRFVPIQRSEEPGARSQEVGAGGPPSGASTLGAQP